MIESYFYKNRLKSMSEKNTGVPYEKFVQDLMQTIIDADGKVGQRNIEVKHNVKLKDKLNNERQFDIYWEYEFGGVVYKTVIECKDYASKITVDKIDSLVGKLKDFPDIKGLFATTQGYQSGAEAKASANGIELLLVRKLNDSDFIDKNGRPKIRKIKIEMHGILPAEIIKFEPIGDKDWIKENTTFDLSLPISFPSCLETEIIINDLELNERYSYRDLRYKLGGEKDKELKFTKTFKNAFLECPNNWKIKLVGLNVLYKIPHWIESAFEINADDIFKGVVEYLSSGVKKMVSKDGKVKDEL